MRHRHPLGNNHVADGVSGCWGFCSTLLIKLQVDADMEAGPTDADLFACEFGERLMPDAEVEAELALCKSLHAWDPWDQPSPELAEAISELASVARGRDTGQRCMLRGQVLTELLCEAAHHDKVPEKFKYNATARYR